MTVAGLYGPQPSPLHAATITDALPAGTGSVTSVAATCRAATVSAPPPGPAGAGCTTCTWYHSAPATAVQLALRLLPLTSALVMLGAVLGTDPSATLKSTGAENGPHIAWQARTFIRYRALRSVTWVCAVG